MAALGCGNGNGCEVSTNMGSSSAMMTASTSIDRGDRVPADIIGGHH